MSPVLFNLAVEYVIRKLMYAGRSLDLGCKISVVGFADDLVLLCEDAETIKLNTTMLMKAGKEVGLKINTDKTKYMVSKRNGNFDDIDIGGNMFDHSEKFKYLGSI